MKSKNKLHAIQTKASNTNENYIFLIFLVSECRLKMEMENLPKP